MKKNSTRILTVNVGSSSIKFALFDGLKSQARIFAGAIELVGRPGARFWAKGADAADNFSRSIKAPDQARALSALIAWLTKRLAGENLAAIGHRVVHGGPDYAAPEVITPKMVAKLRRLVSFDPDHMGQEIAAIEAFRQAWPGLPQVAGFDTAFHHDLPRVAQIVPIPRRYEARGVRRYGFHGLSYQFLMDELARAHGRRAARGRVVLAHLGSGASLAAVDGGWSVDTSMGLTPAGGVPMSTRSGDLDPGLVAYLLRDGGLNAKAFNAMVNRESGLLGVSQTSSDMKELLMRAARDQRCAEAVAVFCYQIKKTIGAYAAALGGLDTLVFAGGIGENAPAIRAIVCDGLGFLGIKIDEEKNAANAPLISAKTGRVAVRVMHTDEELMIARSVGILLNARIK